MEERKNFKEIYVFLILQSLHVWPAGMVDRLLKFQDL